MDAWESLTVNSSLSSGDAWDHLNAQEGGIGVILIDEYLLEVDDGMPDLLIDDDSFVLLVDDTELEIAIDDTEYILEVFYE